MSYLKSWGNSRDNFNSGESLITIRSTFSTSGREDKILLMDGANFEISLPADLSLPAGDSFKPGDTTETVVAYGIKGSPGLHMPYNRADFYVSRPVDPERIPQECSPGTGILYKAVVNNSLAASGQFISRYPLLDCVGDMQVEFEYDTGTGDAVFLAPVLFQPENASNIRNNLMTVRMYILAHEGKRDRSYRYPGDSIQVGDRARLTSGRTISAAEMVTLFGADWRNYRWKLYTIVTRPKNLAQ